MMREPASTTASARSLALLAGLAVSVACADGAPRENAAASGAAIVDGEASGPEQDGVVLLRALLDDGEALCSASLVAPNLLITARHCVSYYTDGFFSCTVNGELIDSLAGAGELGLHLPAANLEVYGSETAHHLLAHGKRVLSTLSPTVCLNDLAFVVLDQDITLPIVPLRLDRSAELNEPVTLVGYGLDDEQHSLDFRSAPRRQKTGLSIAGVGPDSAADGIKDVPARVLILNGPSGCIGDSGGPLLAAGSGALLGVYSLQRAPRCSSPDALHHLVHVKPFRNLINEAFAAAGAEPLAEPTPRPDGGTDANVGVDAASSAGAPNQADAGATGDAGATDTPAGDEPRAVAGPASSCSFGPTPGAAQRAFTLLMLLAPRARRRSAARRATRRAA